jgi:hypothetical protein
VPGEVQREVERRAVGWHVERGGRDGWGELDVGGVLVLHHDLEQGVAAGVPFRVERADELVERRLPVRGGGALADAGGQVGERGVAGEVHAQRDGVEEQTDPVLGPEWTVGDRGAEHEVVLAGEPAEDGGDGAEEGHERGDAVAPAERGELVGEVSG